jgi:hypothetical protein
MHNPDEKGHPFRGKRATFGVFPGMDPSVFPAVLSTDATKEDTDGEDTHDHSLQRNDPAQRAKDCSGNERFRSSGLRLEELEWMPDSELTVRLEGTGKPPQSPRYKKLSLPLHELGVERSSN